MRVIDSHCHPQFSEYDQDRNEVIQQALREGVGMVCVGTNLENSIQAVNLAKEYEGVWASIGLHPNDASRERYDEKEYERLATANLDRVVAIGEIGLDFYRSPSAEERILQKELFIRQLHLAAHLKLPVIMHCRDAHQEMLEILTSQDVPVQGVVHSFTGTMEEANAYVRLGLFLGFNGIITFTDQYNEVVQTVPLEHILVETDAPFLSPEPYRGKRNEPIRVIEVVSKIASLKGIQYESIIKVLKDKTCKFFNIATP